ncbi:MAG TPA: pyridoxal phosphate-dependent aminotransferase [Candidatus Coproplasma avistercoris]|nr:pyridoxal phosphate-dependent aminotransferase [Candidatus Coproplasma avistercoris]
MTLAMSAKAAELKAAGENVISFGVGEPDFNTPAHIVQAAKDALDKGYTKYVAAAGLPALKKAVCNKFIKDNGLDYDPSQVIITNGGKHAIFNALFATIDPGDEVIIPAPYWLTYPEVVKCVGGVPVYIYASREAGFKVRAAQIEGAITPRTKMLIFNSPNNPTGAVYSEKEIRKIANVCEKHNILVLADEIYEKLIYGGEKHFSIAAASPKMRDLTITVNGVSKTYAMTGWRLGYLAAERSIAKAIASFQSHSTSNVNTMTQYAAIAALDGPAEPIDAMVKAFGDRRRRMMELLDGMKPLGLDYVEPNGAFYVMLLCDKFYGMSYEGRTINGSMDMAEMLLTHAKVALTPGICFGDDDCVRLSYALSMEEMEEGLRRIEAFVRAIK